MAQEHVLGVIPCRGGSVRVPRKNAKLLGGKPLMCWSIEAAQGAKTLDYFLVSTNDEEMAKVARHSGAHVPFKRPEKISGDVDSVLVLNHAIEKYEEKKGVRVSHVVCLQPTSPFRNAADIDECVRIAKATGVDSVVSFTKIQQHPYWAFQQKAFGHEMEPFLPEIRLQGENLVSQNLPILWYPNGAIYVVKRDVAMSGRIFGDKIYGYSMPRIRSIDLEEEEDFLYAEVIIPILASKEAYAKSSWMIP